MNLVRGKGDTQNEEPVERVTLEDVEARLMADPEVRAAAEALEPEYQRERARIAARLAGKPRDSGKWTRCPRCHGRGGVPEQTTLDGLPTGELHLCPVCLGLGKVPAE